MGRIHKTFHYFFFFHLKLKHFHLVETVLCVKLYCLVEIFCLFVSSNSIFSAIMPALKFILHLTVLSYLKHVLFFECAHLSDSWSILSTFFFYQTTSLMCSSLTSISQAKNDVICFHRYKETPEMYQQLLNILQKVFQLGRTRVHTISHNSFEPAKALNRYYKVWNMQNLLLWGFV